MPATKQQKIVFPKDITDTLYQILEKHGLGEDPEELFTAIEQGKKLKSQTASELAVKRAKQEISAKDLVVELKTNFGLTQKKAASLAKELEEKVVSTAKKEEIVETSTASAAEIPAGEKLPPGLKKEAAAETGPEEPEKEEEKKPDVYREPVE